MEIKRSNLDALGVIEHEPHRFTAEASTLNLPPGNWPRTIKTDLGNGRPFLIEGVLQTGAIYKQELGCIRLTVWND